MTNFLVPVTVNSLPQISDLEGKQGMFILPDGSINVNRKNGTWMVINKQSDHAGILKPSDNPAMVPGVAKWYWGNAGTYINIGGIIIDNLAIISFDGNDWNFVAVDVPKANGIEDITKTSSEGLVDTYTITFTDGSLPTTFQVKNGQDGGGSLEDFSNSEDITPPLENGSTNMDGGVVMGGGKHTGWISINPKDKLFVKVGFVHDMITSIFKNAQGQIIGNFGPTNGVEKEIEVPENAVAVWVSGAEPLTVRRKSYIDDLGSGVASLLVDAGFYEEIRTKPIIQGFEGVFNAMEKIPINPTNEVILLTLGYGGFYGQNNWDYYDANDVLVGSGKLENGEYAVNKRIYPPANARKITLKNYGRPQFYIKATSETYYNFKYAPKTVKTDVEAQRYYDLGRNRQDLSTRAANNTYGVMLMGQSNATAVGEGTAVSDLATYGLPASQNVRQYNGTASGIYPMQVINQQHWGIEWPLLKKLKDYRPSTEFNYLHKALGGTSLVNDWMPEVFHNSALGGQAADMVADWKNLVPLVNMKCVVWIQGEHDAGTAAYYYQKLKDFIAFLRGASGNANLRFVCMGVHKDSALYYPAVRGAQMQLIGEDPYYHFVNPDDVPMTSGDQIHYNGAMLNLLSQKIFEVIKDF